MTPESSRRTQRPLQVLAWPAFGNATGNPYNRLLYEEMIARGVQVDEFSPEKVLTQSYDVWHMHWPDDLLSEPNRLLTFVRLAGLYALMSLSRLRGTRIIWTVHDLGPHESYHPRLERWFWHWFLPRVDGYITLSHYAREQAEQKFAALRKVPGFVIPHGHYRSAYPNRLNREEARTKLDLAPDQTVTLYLGRIRPYKNVRQLVRTFCEVDDPEAVLLITGSPVTDALAHEIERAAAGDPRIRLTLKFIPDEDMQLYANAADLVVLPYRDIVHSGSALLALSFNRPILVPARGAMEELQEQVGSEWVATYEGAFTPQVLERAVDWARERRRRSEAPLDSLEWDVIAGQTIDAYQAVLEGTSDTK